MSFFTSLRTLWLKYIVRVSHVLYGWRESLKSAESISYSLWLLSCIIAGELWLFVVGLPLFLFVGSRTSVAGLEGAKSETVFRFRLYHFFCWATAVVALVGGSVLAGCYYARLTKTQSVAPLVMYTWSLRDESAENSFLYDPTVVTIANGSAVLKKIERAGAGSALCQAVLEARQPFSFAANDRLVGWEAVATAGTSTVGFQISPDKGTTWYVWEEAGWRKVSAANASYYSSVPELSRHLDKLPRASDGKLDLVFRALLRGKCSDVVGLSSVSVSALQVSPSSIAGSAPTPLMKTDVMLPISTAAAVPSAVWSFWRSTNIPDPEELSLQTLAAERKIVVRGQTLSNAEVVVIFDDARLAYRTRADENGAWRITHEQDFFPLTESEHVVYAISRDPLAPFVSVPSKPLRFVVHDQPVPFSFFAHGTWITLVVLCFLALLSALLVYRERK